jgi:Helicase associated domain
MDRLRDLVRYKERHGDCNVPFQFKEDQRLANWVLKQRKYYRRGELSPRRIRHLSDVGFMWTSYRRVTWEQRFEQLRLYQQRHGTTLVSQHRGVGGVAGGGFDRSSTSNSAFSPMDADTVALAPWVKKQRTTQRKKEMGLERVAMLDSIGFVWDVEDSSWEGRFVELLQFARVHGTYANPKDAGLKGWVYRQRYKYHENALSEEKRKKLDAIGFQWGQPCTTGGGKKDVIKKNNKRKASGLSQECDASNPNPLSSLVNACLMVSTTNAPTTATAKHDAPGIQLPPQADATHSEGTEAPGSRYLHRLQSNCDAWPSRSSRGNEALELGAAATGAIELVAKCAT